jgi:hypothetical protein
LAGWITNGMPPVSAPVQNGTTVLVDGISNNATITGGTTLSYTQLGASALIPADTELASGAAPQTVAPTAFQIASLAAGMMYNQGSSTAGAATLNTVDGVIETESLTTAAGATYTFTLTNSLITSAASPIPQVALRSATNTAGGVQLNSITNGTGSTVAVFQNSGTAAWNGKLLFTFHI